MRRTIILMLDSFGIGSSEDASSFGDEGSNTLGNIIKAFPNIKLSNMQELGLYNCLKQSCGKTFGKETVSNPKTVHGYGVEKSSGKDTVSGHWELMGCVVDFEWGYFHNEGQPIPQNVLDDLYKLMGIKGSLGNSIASGTEIIAQYHEEHAKTGLPIFYTSADSVLQIAANEDPEIYGLEKLYNHCEIARQELYKYNIGRIIARPFKTENGVASRTGNRKDYTIEPNKDTLLDVAKESGLEVVSVGKIFDIFAGKGLTHKIKANGLEDIFNQTLNAMSNHKTGIIFSNFVDFDAVYGHRRDVKGYKEGLEYFDSRLPEIMSQLSDDDLLVIVADHGCDPTWKGTDHTREHVPVILYNNRISGHSVGSVYFSDVGASIASFHGLPKLNNGKSFL